jgi:hypothetical protein
VNLDIATKLESDIDQAMTRGDLDRAEVLAQRYRAEADAAVEGPAVMAPRFRARYLAAQVSLVAGRLREASARFAALMPLPGDLPAALACRIWLMSAEVLARLHRHVEARGHLIRAQAFPAALAESPLLKLRELRIRLWLGHVYDLAEELAACGQGLYQRGDLDNLALLFCEEGRAWDATGRLDRAEACWARGEEISRANPGSARADVLIQLGRLEHLRGNLQAALDHYEAAATCAAGPQRQEAQLRRLLVLLDLGQQRQARTALEAALAGARPEALADEVQSVARMACALVHGELDSATSTEEQAHDAARRGETKLARDFYLEALRETNAPARRARLALALGLLALAGRDGAEAKRWLAQAENLASQESLPEVRWRAVQARGQLAAEIDDNDELAQELFEKAVLLSEAQAARLTHRADAVTYGLRRGDVLRRLLRAACRRGDSAAVFRYQEMERGRVLLDLWRAAPAAEGRARLAADDRLADLDRRIAALQREVALAPGRPSEALLQRREELLLQRDHLFDAYLRDRSKASAALPSLAELAELERELKPGTVYLAPAIVDDELFLLVCRPNRPAQVVAAPGSALSLTQQIADLRRCLDAQLERYRLGCSLGLHQRAELDGRLEDLGRGCLGAALTQILDGGEKGPERVLWVPDGALHGVPLGALRQGGRYLIETHEVVYTFSGSLLVHQGRCPVKPRRLARALVLTESPEVLPAAAREGQGVAATFWRSRVLHGAQAGRAALRQHLPGAAVVHLACHACFDARHPLAASIDLPSGETWRALEWLDEPLDGLPLVTLSACRSAEVAALAGREVFGLVTGLLGSGVRSVVAGLWPVADQEALPLMWRFYRARLGADLPAALAQAQREALRQPHSSPLFWSAFALFGDPAALPAPGMCWRWLARRRQARHARRFPLPSPLAPEGD